MTGYWSDTAGYKQYDIGPPAQRIYEKMVGHDVFSFSHSKNDFRRRQYMIAKTSSDFKCVSTRRNYAVENSAEDEDNQMTNN